MITPLEILELIFKLLTVIGLIGIVVGVVRRRTNGDDFPLYALAFTAGAAALWIIVSLLLQR
jgi:cytochrome c oxidase assembly factor CtaG